MEDSISDNDSGANATGDNNDIGSIVLLDLPKHSKIDIDGFSTVLQTDDFIGLQNVPSTVFHLVTTAAAASNNETASMSLTIGFIIYEENPVTLIRKYNPQTEEVDDTVDDQTKQNLLHQIRQKQISPTRVLNYYQTSDQQLDNVWKEQTRYINESNILPLRGVESGDKIVPGSYNDDKDDDDENDDDFMDDDNKNHNSDKNEDGKSIFYPPIPVIDTKVSVHSHKHTGTKKYLSRLSPAERTELFRRSSSYILQRVLKEYYNNSWKAMLGDVQLSFCLFLYLHCYRSLEHWKDLVAMLSLCCNSNPKTTDHNELYTNLLQVLPYQLSSIDSGFLEDIDEAGGNFLLPSLQRLQRNLCDRHQRHEIGSNIEQYQTIINNFQHVLENKFPQTFKIQELSSRDHHDSNDNDHFSEDDDDDDDDAMVMLGDDDVDVDVDDEDGPVMVSVEEIEASLARSAETTNNNNNQRTSSSIPNEIQTAYPLLTAAVMPNEDILMTCARALDEKNDVSLVREAAAYLEQVEQFKQV
jgi:A1 cistron-splicing factor AAR2